MSDPVYYLNGPGAGLVPFPALTFITTEDPLLGSPSNQLPEGPFNRELHKLLKNTGALADLFKAYLNRTVGVVNTNAPDTAPQPPTGAPVTPGDKIIHAVFYTNFEVHYQYDGIMGTWSELLRLPRTASVFQRYHKKVTVATVDGEDNVLITIPTTDFDNTTAVDFDVDDIKLFYVNNLDPASPVIGTVQGLIPGTGTVRVLLSTAPGVGLGVNYEVICLFEKILII